MSSLINILLDPENEENITLYNDEDEPVEFEQVATIPHKVNDEILLYAILKPVTPPEGMDEMSVMVFRVDLSDDEEEDDAVLVVEEDDDIAEAVFAEFERLLSECEEEITEEN